MQPFKGEPLLLLTKEFLNHMISHFMQQAKPYFNKPHKDNESFHLKIKSMIEEDDYCNITGSLYLENEKLFYGGIGAFTIPGDMDFIDNNVDIEAIWNVYPDVIVTIYPIGTTKQVD